LAKWELKVVGVVVLMFARAVMTLGVVGVEAEAPLAPAQASSTGASRLGISLLRSRTELKNFSAVLRSLKVISVEAGVVWISVNSPIPWEGC
jgi:3-deoxy-D-manno-octulosonic acid (KDO) 8-phosphate synthase